MPQSLPTTRTRTKNAPSGTILQAACLPACCAVLFKSDGMVLILPRSSVDALTCT